jgi:Flp pilus assembly protein TadG
MRRIAEVAQLWDRERGAISIMVAVLMVTLLGFAAIAVDVGMLHAERTQLRNGADAAALAIAQKCAHNINDADLRCHFRAGKRSANKNAGDGASNIASIVVDKAAGTVMVIRRG